MAEGQGRKTYYDTVRDMTRDPKLLKAVDKAERQDKSRASRRQP